MKFESIAVEQVNDVTIVRLDDPATLNALTLMMIEELNCAFDAVEGSARAMIIAGAGKGFCSGAGLKGGLASKQSAVAPDFGSVLETHLNPLMTRLRSFSIPWISAVRGPAAGGGCSLALAGDLVVASETAYFVQAFARIGLVPDCGSSHLLARGTSRVRAMELMLLGERLSAARALDWGLVNRVVADGDLEATALELATRLASGPTKTLSNIRALAWQAADADWSVMLQTERDMQRAAGLTQDAAEGIRAFREKRPAKFEGH